MIAANNKQQPLEPNVVYLEDKPLKINKKRKSTVRKKATLRKTRKSLKELNMEDCIDIKRDSNIEDQQDEEPFNVNDPLYTPTQIDIKCELKEDKIDINEDYEEEEIYLDSENDEDYHMDEYEEDDINEQEEEDWAEDYEIKSIRKKLINKKVKKEKNASNSSEDESLKLLTKTKPSIDQKKKNTRSFRACPETCKYKCTKNFNEQQRSDIFECYRNLSKENKLNFIRQHMRRKVLTRIRINYKSGNFCCYFLKHYTPNENPIIKEFETQSNDDNLIKVCHLFFEYTLHISYLRIKEAIKGYELKKEKHVLPTKKIIYTKNNPAKIEEKEQPKPQLFLDPETGNLTDTKPKTKRPKTDKSQRIRIPKPVNCHIKCKFKCHEKFTEEERQQICNTFWSLDYKRRRDYILSRIEKVDVKSATSEEFRTSNRSMRAYQTRMFLRTGLNGENKRVCKDYMLKTLCVSRDIIENALEFADKTTGFYIGVDRRGGKNPTIIKQCAERKKLVVDHISSYPFWVPNKKSKTKYLHYSLTIKKLYDDYKEKCLAQQKKFTSTFYYYTTFHKEFRLAFLTHPHQPKNKYQLSNTNISNYTGEEAGGYWVDIKDNKLDMRFIDPAQSLEKSQQNCSASTSTNTGTTDVTPINLNVADTSLSLVSSSRVLDRSDLNISLYENLSRFYKNV